MTAPHDLLLPESIKQSESEKIEFRLSVNSPPTPVGSSGQSPTIHVLNSLYLSLQSNLCEASAWASEEIECLN